ncbi:MAG: hypothetical protein AAFV69_13175 [Pseudomonadota bacterium]
MKHVYGLNQPGFAKIASTAIVLALTAGLTAGAALTDAAPANVDECLEKSFAAANKAKDKGLSEEAMSALEPMLEKLEGECDSGKLDAAAATLKELDAKITGS